MSDAVHRFIVAYDISLDPRRNGIAKVLESYGDRIQYSVFIIDVKPAKMVRLRASLQEFVDTATDSVMICDLGPLDRGGLSRVTFVGMKRPITGQGPLVL